MKIGKIRLAVGMEYPTRIVHLTDIHLSLVSFAGHWHGFAEEEKTHKEHLP